MSDEKDEVTQNNEKEKPEKKLFTTEDQAMEIPDEKESIKELAIDAYVIKKIKGRIVRNGQKQLFIKWENLSHNESTWEPQENMSSEAILKSYFKKGLDIQLSCKCLF